MGKRGPQPGNLRSIEERFQERPKPPAGITVGAKKVWQTIVSDLPVDYFKPADLPLLRAYCESAATHIKATKKIQKENEVVYTKYSAETDTWYAPRRNPWFDVQKESASTMASLATKLRLCTNARISGWKAETESKQKPKSKREGLMFSG